MNTEEAKYVESVLQLILAQNEMIERYNEFNHLGKTEDQLINLCKENQIPYIFFYDEQSYRENESISIAKFYMKDDKCFGSKMST